MMPVTPPNKIKAISAGSHREYDNFEFKGGNVKWMLGDSVSLENALFLARYSTMEFSRHKFAWRCLIVRKNRYALLLFVTINFLLDPHNLNHFVCTYYTDW